MFGVSYRVGSCISYFLLTHRKLNSTGNFFFVFHPTRNRSTINVIFQNCVQFDSDFDRAKEVTTIRLIKLDSKGQHSTCPE